MFTYTLHVFMAVTGMFFVTILFCRKGVYHPDELGADRPLLAAVLIVMMLSAYAVYPASAAERQPLLSTQSQSSVTATE